MNTFTASIIQVLNISTVLLVKKWQSVWPPVSTWNHTFHYSHY